MLSLPAPALHMGGLPGFLACLLADVSMDCLPLPSVLTPQIAACAEVTVVSAADVPAEVLEKEKAIEMEKEDIKSKPEAIRWVQRMGHH